MEQWRLESLVRKHTVCGGFQAESGAWLAGSIPPNMLAFARKSYGPGADPCRILLLIDDLTARDGCAAGAAALPGDFPVARAGLAVTDCDLFGYHPAYGQSWVSLDRVRMARAEGGSIIVNGSEFLHLSWSPLNTVAAAASLIDELARLKSASGTPPRPPARGGAGGARKAAGGSAAGPGPRRLPADRRQALLSDLAGAAAGEALVGFKYDGACDQGYRDWAGRCPGVVGPRDILLRAGNLLDGGILATHDMLYYTPEGSWGSFARAAAAELRPVFARGNVIFFGQGHSCELHSLSGREAARVAECLRTLADAAPRPQGRVHPPDVGRFAARNPRAGEIICRAGRTHRVMFAPAILPQRRTEARKPFPRSVAYQDVVMAVFCEGITFLLAREALLLFGPQGGKARLSLDDAAAATSEGGRIVCGNASCDLYRSRGMLTGTEPPEVREAAAADARAAAAALALLARHMEELFEEPVPGIARTECRPGPARPRPAISLVPPPEGGGGGKA